MKYSICIYSGSFSEYETNLLVLRLWHLGQNDRTYTVARLSLKAIGVDINYVFVIFILLLFCAMFVAAHIVKICQVPRYSLARFNLVCKYILK